MKKSGFLTVIPAKTALFFAWFITTCKLSRSSQGLLEFEKKSKGKQALFRDN